MVGLARGRLAVRSARKLADPPITLSEHDGVRTLHFGTEWVQGAMRIRKPDAIEIEYVRRMCAWLLLREAPVRIAQLGLGAGALTRWALARLPQTECTVVESSASVIQAAHTYFALPRDEPRLRIVHADAADFVACPRQRGRFGVLQVDVYDRHARGPAIDSPEFYAACRTVLEPPGVAVFNLFNEPGSGRSRMRIRDAFDGRAIELPPAPQGNIVVLALAGPPLDVDAARVLDRGAAVRQRFDLQADLWAKMLLDTYGHDGRLRV